MFFFLEIFWIQYECADLEEIYWIYGKSTESAGNLYFIPELFYLKLGNSVSGNYPVADQGFPRGGGRNPPGKHEHRSLPKFPPKPKKTA